MSIGLAVWWLGGLLLGIWPQDQAASPAGCQLYFTAEGDILGGEG